MLTIRDGADLVGIAPLYICSDVATGARQLTLLGNGISDRCDILIDPNHGGVDKALADGICARREAWNAYDFRDLPAGSALIPMMRDAFGESISEDSSCIVIQLERWGSTGEGVLPTKFLADLRRRRRRAEEVGPVRLELAGPKRVAQALETLFDLHALRWRALGQRGVLGESCLLGFHVEVAERFAQRQWLRLHCLHVGDLAAAANYGFLLRGRGYYYIGGFDPEWTRLGVGGIILHEIIRKAAEEGAEAFDFLRGTEEYKLRWGGRTRPQYRVRSFSAAVSEGE